MHGGGQQALGGVFIEQKQSSSRFEENDVGTAQKEGEAAGNCLKKTNAGNRKRRNVNSPTGNDEKRKRDGSLTDSKGVDANIGQVEGSGQEEEISSDQGDESREEFEDARNGAQSRNPVEQDEASVETVDFGVVDQEGQGGISNKHAIIDLTGDHGMEEAQKELVVTSGVRVNNCQGKVSGKDGNDVFKEVNERPADPRYKFCDSCMRRRREIPCYKCYKFCDVCLQFKRKKWFHRLRRDEGIIRVCDSCRKKTREEIEAEPQTQGLEVPVRRSLRKSAQKSTAEGFYTDHCFSWDGTRITAKDNSQVGEVNTGINGKLNAKAVNAVEEKPAHVPRHMHCGVCEEFRGSESFKGQNDEGGVKVCGQCRKRRDTEVEEVVQVHPSQGMPLYYYDDYYNYIYRRKVTIGFAFSGFKYCDVCEESLSSSNFKRQSGEFVRSVCNPCRKKVEAEAEAHGLQGCLFPKFP